MVQSPRIGRRFLVAALGLVGLIVVGPAALAGAPATPTVQGSPGTARGAVTVAMKDFLFAPATLTIHAGQAVVWTYNESASDLMPNCETIALQIPGSPVTCPGHSTTAGTATGPNGKPLWDSGVHRAPGFPYSVRFTTPGTYAYHCTVHGGRSPNNPVTHMNGTIVVLAAASPPAATAPPAPTPTAVPSTPAAPNRSAAPVAGATLPNTGRLPGRPWAVAAVVLAGATTVVRRRLVGRISSGGR